MELLDDALGGSKCKSSFLLWVAVKNSSSSVNYYDRLRSGVQFDLVWYTHTLAWKNTLFNLVGASKHDH